MCKKPVEEEKEKSNGSSLKKETTNTPQQINTSINRNSENKQKMESINSRLNTKSLYEKFKESLKEINDAKRSNFRQLFFDTLCKKEKMSKEDENILKEDALITAKTLAIEIEESRFKSKFRYL
jgi:hypothetical protein